MSEFDLISKSNKLSSLEDKIRSFLGLDLLLYPEYSEKFLDAKLSSFDLDKTLPKKITPHYDLELLYPLLGSKYLLNYDPLEIDNNELILEKVESEIKTLEKLGFTYYQDWTMDFPRVPERVKVPTEMFPLSHKEISKRYVHSSPIFLAANYLFGLYNLDVSCELRQEETRSFIDHNDEKQAGKKYGNTPRKTKSQSS